MSNPVRIELEKRLRVALDAIGQNDFSPFVTASADTRFGDYQTNAAMMLAKAMKTNPREIAAQLIEHLEVSDLSEPPEIAGAGFINFRLTTDYISRKVAEIAFDQHRFGVPRDIAPGRVVVDFSAPNVAKPMHVGHIRSTILGDSLARIATFLGHEVVTDNHIGDWGTQFGKVIYGWKHFLDQKALKSHPVKELVRLYRRVNALCDADEDLLTTCREELVKLQAGDKENLAIWNQAVSLSKGEFDNIYQLLDVHFSETLGESFYNDRLGPLAEKLAAENIAEISDGALCIFFPEDKELADKPCLIRKGDGGFLYATTDLATLEYRVERWAPDAIWYVTGAPQRLHFQQIFAVAAKMGITVEMSHIAFGSILGEDRKLMKTRSGDNVQLSDVLTEACDRAYAIVQEKNPQFTTKEKRSIARIIGIGAVKYAELSQNRMTDYVFSWDKMLSFQGNTAPYLQNAYVRIQSIFRKAGDIPPLSEAARQRFDLNEAQELALAKKLFQFAEAVPLVLEDFRPNLLANYLYELANTFHTFYEACPVLKSQGRVLETRLALCQLSADVLKTGLSLLGIGVPERM